MATTGMSHARLEHQVAVCHRTLTTLRKRAQESDNPSLADDAFMVCCWLERIQTELLRRGHPKDRLVTHVTPF